MKIIKTNQDKIEIYPFDIGRPEPKGLETSALVLSEKQFYELFYEMIKFNSGYIKGYAKVS